MGAGFAQALFALDAADGSVNAGSLVWNGLLQALLGYVQLDSLEAPSDRNPPFFLAARQTSIHPASDVSLPSRPYAHGADS